MDAEPDDGPYTVSRALEAYFADRARRGSKGLAKERAGANVRIQYVLGGVDLAKLTPKRIEDWHAALAMAPKLGRCSRFAKGRKEKPNPMGVIAAQLGHADTRMTTQPHPCFLRPKSKRCGLSSSTLQTRPVSTIAGGRPR